ncbi:MAG: hypothetical protein KJ808_07900 [Acidobacteria bacterium]|nr:hypothetical protein [Acidobacteriota bacterium]MBU4308162.1 hypothetical protein [Acidobacteriota bacterium]
MRTKKNRPRIALKNNKKIGRSPLKTNRIVNKSVGFREAQEWDIMQQISMTPEQRQRAAKELKLRFFGKKSPDVRAPHTGG